MEETQTGFLHQTPWLAAQEAPKNGFAAAKRPKMKVYSRPRAAAHCQSELPRAAAHCQSELPRAVLEISKSATPSSSKKNP